MKKIINFCPTGTQSTKENSSAPISHNEIIAEVAEANSMGITIVHIHARDDRGENTYKKESYQRIIDGIKRECPDLVISVSLSGRYFHDLVLRTEVLSLKPDMGSLTMSSMNFPKSASVNDPEAILFLISEMKKYKVTPEIECFDTGMLRYTTHLQQKGILEEYLYINMIFGNLSNDGDDVRDFAHVKSFIPKKSKVCFGGIGKSQLKANIYGLLEADGIRVGIEDNFYFSQRIKASNSQLLQRIYQLANTLQIQFMSPVEFRELGILHG